MNQTNTKKLVEYWVKGSQLDFESAVSIAFKAKSYVQACFFLHLAVEKILKAYIVFHTRAHAPYLHNLPQLAKLTELDFKTHFQELLVEINDFNIRCRYPDDRYTIYKTTNLATAKRLIKEGQELIEWISDKLKS